MGGSLSTVHAPNWQDACAARFNCTSQGLLDMHAQPISCPANSTIQATPAIWGITYEACEAKCGMNLLVQSVDFYSAANSITTWLLPWIALIAQLPFEADGWMDFLSACLCVGSPALATYSLALTMFNRGYIATKFQRLKEAAEDTQERYRYMVERVSAAAFILQESQQCPMRANQRTGELANLITLPDRQNFWKTAAKDLKNTRRGFTYSFLAQVIFAFLSYLVSFIGAVHDSLGSPDVGLQFASSAVWAWMFPIVFGYIRVGSQLKAGSIKEGLLGNTAMQQHDIPAEAEVAYQKGLRPNADLYWPLPSAVLEKSAVSTNSRPLTHDITPLHASTSRLRVPFHGSNQDDEDQLTNGPESTITLPAIVVHDAAVTELDRVLPPPTWFGMDVQGDEQREGPIFNYARIFTWFAFADHVGGGFETAVEQFRAKKEIPTRPEDAAARCDFRPREDLPAFKAWSNIPHAAIHHMFYAAGLALFLQWGTTGAAIFVAYTTPAVGLGCRSGSYLIYGVAATISWIFLVLSSFLSHATMQRLERNPERPAGILGALAVLMRIAGKAIAIANAGWLITSSVLEDLGTFQTCWCQTCAFQFHHSGWTPVFKGASDLRNAASGTWIGSFMWSITICSIVIVIFAYGRH
ncbi:hypothetical protein MSAN_01901600 [Mycena sanguinolenta]|uniref:Uncharacterized protein n=1 Tax=Mycena sanguinolenta TaxID=230812 RepID=A0A8H7CPE4_9AGAR|nr:hypothetical protein MSAN_01901600 [Mycena sanguinolenta]